MNDAVLSQRLRALRVPPPLSGFEQRLREALSKEAQVRLASTAVSRARRLAARRWSVRAGLTLAVALGASAAAAAAGWVSWPSFGGSSESSVPAAGSEPRRQRPVPPARVEVERRTPPAEEGPSAPVLPRVADLPVESTAATPPRAGSGLRSLQAKRAHGRPVDRAERPKRSKADPPAVRAPSAGLPAIVPFELPGVDGAGARSGATPAGGPGVEETSARRGPRAMRPDAERPLPKLDHSPPERAERGASELMRERGRTRETLGRENAERGLDRAREARERNAK